MRRALLTLALLGVPVSAGAGEVVRRAVVVSANDGGVELEPLAHTDADAQRVAEVLQELGGFEPTDVVLVSGADHQAVVEALGRMADVPVGEEDESLFLFYYSGHADARGLRLKSEVLTYQELKELVRAVPADVHLGILDACQSGAIARVKGAAVADPFLDEQTLAAEGEAWIAASSADEEAQESDHIEGSFFTHYLVSGLRGAADDGDGVVSLTEAYDYAHDRTVAHTAGTTAGTQHPSYDYRLQGNGDLPLTDVRRASATVLLPEDLSGVVTVLREPDRLPVAEVAKIPGRPGRLALPPGQYTLRLRDRGDLRQVRVGLSEGSSIEVDRWGDARGEVATAKGAMPVWLGEAGDEPVADPSDEFSIKTARDDEGLTIRVNGNIMDTVESHLERLHTRVQRKRSGQEEEDELREVEAPLEAVPPEPPPPPEAPPVEPSPPPEAPPAQPPPPEPLTETGSVTTLERPHRPLRGLAVALNVPVPGLGQMIQGRWGAGLAFMGGAYLFTATGYTRSAFLGNGGLAAGSSLGPNLATMAGTALWVWSMADAAWVDRGEFHRPRRGVTVSAETVWHEDQWTVPHGTGVAADWIVAPGVSVGIDRVGFVNRPDGIGVLSAGLRSTLGPELHRVRPALLLSLDSRHYFEAGEPQPEYVEPVFHPSMEHLYVSTWILGVGGQVRWYATPHYFLQGELRWEVEPATGDQGVVAGGGLGFHFGEG